MQTLTAHFKWNKYKERWIARTQYGDYLEEFPDCGWFNKLYAGFDKRRTNVAEITVKLIGYDGPQSQPDS